MGDQKLICQKCLESTDSEEKVVVENRCYHKDCCSCCVCGNISKALKVLDCQIYCQDCFDNKIASNRTEATTICQKCFKPIDHKDITVIGRKCYHKNCCACCVCGNLPKAVKAFKCQIYCQGCFEKQITSTVTESKSICHKCLEPIDPLDKAVIGNKCYHKDCCSCSVCGNIPKSLNTFECEIYCHECFKCKIDNTHCKSICPKCLLPIDPRDRVVVGYKCYHKGCCACCVCGKIAEKLKVFHHQTYCHQCFQTKKRMNMAKPRSICQKCLDPIDLEDKVVIGNQCFHKECCACCVCGMIPNVLKVFNCQIYCPNCFQKCMNCRNRRNFYKIHKKNINHHQTTSPYETSKKNNTMMHEAFKRRLVPVIWILKKNEHEDTTEPFINILNMPGCSKHCYGNMA